MRHGGEREQNLLIPPAEPSTLQIIVLRWEFCNLISKHTGKEDLCFSSMFFGALVGNLQRGLAVKPFGHQK